MLINILFYLFVKVTESEGQIILLHMLVSITMVILIIC